MRRREFITILGRAAAAWPLAARAQTSCHLGILALTGAQSARARGLFAAFDQGMKEHGWIEGQNVSWTVRLATGKLL
jgi:putative tryptophan/tyrosine transport system substrate-binding protein